MPVYCIILYYNIFYCSIRAFSLTRSPSCSRARPLACSLEPSLARSSLAPRSLVPSLARPLAGGLRLSNGGWSFKLCSGFAP